VTRCSLPAVYTTFLTYKMLLYADIISGDEMFSSAYKMTEVDDIVYEVECLKISIRPGADVDIGANPSAEEQEEAVEDGATQEIDLVYHFRLQKTVFDKKAFLGHLKGYMKAISNQVSPERKAGFQSKAQDYAKKIMANFADYDMYIGQSMDVDGMVALLNYREDGITPYFTFWKDGLKEVKC